MCVSGSDSRGVQLSGVLCSMCLKGACALCLRTLQLATVAPQATQLSKKWFLNVDVIQ